MNFLQDYMGQTKQEKIVNFNRPAVTATGEKNIASQYFFFKRRQGREQCEEQNEPRF